MQIIEHNPHERKLTNGVWWAAFSMLTIQWIGMLYLGWVDWLSAAVGFTTGGVFANWATEKLERAPKSKRADDLLKSSGTRSV